MKKQITLSQFNEAVLRFRNMVNKEPIDVYFEESSYRMYGAELAILRLVSKYSNSMADGTARFYYSENLEEWVFVLESRYFFTNVELLWNSKKERAEWTDRV